jgi:hypothetical protein
LRVCEGAEAKTKTLDKVTFAIGQCLSVDVFLSDGEGERERDGGSRIYGSFLPVRLPPNALSTYDRNGGNDGKSVGKGSSSTWKLHYGRYLSWLVHSNALSLALESSVLPLFDGGPDSD